MKTVALFPELWIASGDNFHLPEANCLFSTTPVRFHITIFHWICTITLFVLPTGYYCEGVVNSSALVGENKSYSFPLQDVWKWPSTRGDVVSTNCRNNQTGNLSVVVALCILAGQRWEVSQCGSDHPRNSWQILIIQQNCVSLLGIYSTVMWWTLKIDCRVGLSGF
jgi:hypothetical protein